MVTGGCDLSGGCEKSHHLDTTEVYEDNVWKTVAGKLPVGTSGLRAITINNRVLLFGMIMNYHIFWFLIRRFLGGWDGFNVYNNILEYNPEIEEWQEVGAMEEERYVSGVSLVSYADYADMCN